MDPNIEFSNKLFDEFTLDFSTYAMDQVTSLQDKNSLEVTPYAENTPLNQDLATNEIGDISFILPVNLETPLPTPNYCTSLIHPYNNEAEKEFLTPLVSPAITPNFSDMYQLLDPNPEQYFTPLSSPALLPNGENLYFLDGSSTTNNQITNMLTDVNVTTGHTANNVTVSSSSDSLLAEASIIEASPKNIVPRNKSVHDIITDIQDPSVLAQQLAQIEAKQQILREQMKMSPLMSPTYRKSPLGLYSSGHQNPPSPLPFSPVKKRTSLRQKIALASPKIQASQQRFKPQSPTILPSNTPATPASLMKIGHHPPANSASSAYARDKKVVDAMPSLPPAALPSPVVTPSNKKRKLAPSALSPRTPRPLISPFLQPGPTVDLSPTTLSPSIEIRRSAHKVAEQRRRDTLKQSFDSLRNEIVDVLVENSGQPAETVREEKEKEVKLMSKVLLLQHSYEYIVRLKEDSLTKDAKMKQMQEELENLRQLAQEQQNEA